MDISDSGEWITTKQAAHILFIGSKTPSSSIPREIRRRAVSEFTSHPGKVGWRWHRADVENTARIRKGARIGTSAGAKVMAALRDGALELGTERAA